MPGYNWDRVQELFLAAADLAESEQPAWLDSACMGDTALREEVESLLRADRSSGASLATAVESAAGSLLEEPPIVGLRLGAYRVIREIGRGGIGAVYLAIHSRHSRLERLIGIGLTGLALLGIYGGHSAGTIISIATVGMAAVGFKPARAASVTAVSAISA